MESLQRLDPPQPLGKLTLLARLGEGGMATVYVAATGHGPLARLCAVKLLRADVPDSDYRKRFMDEATLVVRLHHNNLIDVREAGEQAGQLYIVMELCEGRDLADLWDRCAAVGRAFPVPLSVYLVREALRGLHYAHTFGGLSLVHRDISPSNLLVDWAGAVRVADFGLATSVLKATATMPGMVFGKVGYMAPEQATRSELDGRADVYSCGVVLWELLTGRPLRESGLDTEAVARFAARRPSTSSRRVDPLLDDIVMRALEPDPQRRFADAGQFMRALSDWLVRNAPQTDQETLAEFMRGLFPDAQVRDHEAYGALLAGVVGPTTGVFQRGEAGAPTREIGPFQDTEDLAVGMIIAERYRIEQELGRGGMGTVYLAEHVTVGRKVAVKVLTREWSTHETVAKRFREEARAASAAGHPNIVEVFDAGTLPDGRLYLVMEHLHGRSLYDELCVTGPMPVERALAIFRDIARGIAAAHAVGIIHRDLKPDNVMLVRRGGEIMVKLLDFGIAASADRVAEDRRLTQPGHTLGTPEYMAPEQAKGRPPTELVDIYALGAMLYEMLVGQPPFVGENYVEVL
ncbi:MAG: serine/threonine protein kinase, partial [Myxococcales bacterium]|nr:serine/threonine protein kinase [Myxococcales bacterium]